MKAYLLIFPIQNGFMQLDQLSIEHKHTNIFKVNIVANHGVVFITLHHLNVNINVHKLWLSTFINIYNLFTDSVH